MLVSIFNVTFKSDKIVLNEGTSDITLVNYRSRLLCQLAGNVQDKIVVDFNAE